MTLSRGVNSIGLVITILGVIIVYKYSPLNSNFVDGGTAAGPSEKDLRFGNKIENLMLKIGVGLVVLGTLIQIVSNFISD